MVVKTHCQGRRITALDVGIDNVKRHFTKRISAIDFDLGHLQIRCELSAEFWNGHPEITDRRLCSWLENKNFKRSFGESFIFLDMIPEGNNSFRLEIASTAAISESVNAPPPKKQSSRPSPRRQPGMPLSAA